MATIKSPAAKNKPKTELEDVFQLLDKSVNKLTKDNLTELSIPDLTVAYSRIEGGMIQARYQQCKIIREIRNRFGNDNNAFSQFFKEEGVPALMRELSPDTRTRMIQIADFFDSRPIEGVSWTVAISLSKPKYVNSSVSVQVYDEVYGSGASVDQVMNRLEELHLQKKITNESTIDGEFKVVNNDLAVAESTTNQLGKQTIYVDDEKDEEQGPIIELIPVKLNDLKELEDIIIRLCQQFAIKDILITLKRVTRKFRSLLPEK